MAGFSAQAIAAGAKPAAPSAGTEKSALAVGSLVKENPKAAPKIVSDAINSNPNGCVHSPAITSAAITALPQPASKTLIADIVYSAVKACPDSVLSIVSAAVAAAPTSAAEEIVAAAVSAVPDPYKMVSFPGTKVGSDYKGTADYKSAPEEMPLVDAIVKAAYGAAEGLNLDALALAADTAIKHGLSRTLAGLEDPRLLFGVGDEGLTNYENEPRYGVEGPGAASQ
jgi:hypothetical protein